VILDLQHLNRAIDEADSQRRREVMKQRDTLTKQEAALDQIAHDLRVFVAALHRIEDAGYSFGSELPAGIS
jgi:hypothetical protein